MPNYGGWPVKAVPVVGDKVVGADSATGQLADFTLGSLGVGQVVAKTANYTVTQLDGYVLVDTTGGNIAITLPASALALGREYIIKRTTAGGNSLTITPASGTVDGGASVSLASQWNVSRLFCDGTNWFTF